MGKNKLFSLSKVWNKFDNDIDSVEFGKKGQSQYRRAFDILLQTERYWANMQKFRKDRARNKNFTFGDQWKDLITVDGRTMSEEDYIISQGNVPLKNNLIRRLVRNVVGTYRQQEKEPICTARDRDEQSLGETMTTILQYNMQLNKINELDARNFEEYLISGAAIYRKWFGWRKDRLDCWTDLVSPNNWIIDPNMKDPRGWDCEFIGELHDISFEELCQKFAKTKEDYFKLKDIYNVSNYRKRLNDSAKEFGYSELNNLDFYMPEDSNLYRVIEVWRKETKPRLRCFDPNKGEIYKIEIEDEEEMVTSVNNERIAMGLAAGMTEDDIPLIKTEFFTDSYWYFYKLTPFGHILEEGETPYEHKEHPYVFKLFPFIDGEIHSFVGDVIDQQRYTNRLITMYDWIMRASAKGVLLFPEECIPTGMDINDIADEWSRFNGVIAIKTKGTTEIPKQISNNATNIGISELLNLQLKLFEDISGVNGALQGKPGYSGISASLYSQQTQNATTSLLDILDSYSQFIVDSAYKDVSNIQQFYDHKKVINIAGRKGEDIIYDPDKIQDVKWDLSIVESTSTPTYRKLANDFLIQIWSANQITLEQLLEHGDFPFADSLLQSLRAQREELEKGGVPEQIPHDIVDRAQAGVDIQNLEKYQQPLKG